MSNDNPNEAIEPQGSDKSPKELATAKFLEILELKVTDIYHKRLLKACQESDPLRAMENELNSIIKEICDEA